MENGINESRVVFDSISASQISRTRSMERVLSSIYTSFVFGLWQYPTARAFTGKCFPLPEGKKHHELRKFVEFFSHFFFVWKFFAICTERHTSIYKMYLNVLNFKWTRNLVYSFFGCDSLGVCSYAFVFVYRSLMLLLCFLPLCPIILPMNSWIGCGLLRCCCMNATEWIEEPAEQQERKKNGKIWLMNVVFLPVERNVIRSLFRIVIPFQYPHTHTFYTWTPVVVVKWKMCYIWQKYHTFTNICICSKCNRQNFI